MIFFIWRKNVLFSRYLDFCIFVKSTDFKICDVIIDITTQWKLHLCLYFWILSTIKMKFDQIVLCCMRNISNMFLARCWTLETSSRPFYDFTRMPIEQDLTIFNSWHLPFLIFPYSPFQKKLKHWNLDKIGY